MYVTLQSVAAKQRSFSSAASTISWHVKFVLIEIRMDKKEKEAAHFAIALGKRDTKSLFIVNSGPSLPPTLGVVVCSGKL